MTLKTPTVTRRDLISKVGKGAAAVAVASALPVPTTAAGDGQQKHYGMVIDTRRCSGCHACSVACKSEFDVPLGNTRSWVEYTEKGHFPDVSRSFLPRLCNQCSEPQCVSVCPTGATVKREEDGIVTVDADICIGCKYCLQACPYDARFINPITGAADKCDFCLHRVSQGVVPSCVNTCPGKARIFGDLNDPKSDISKVLNANRVTVLRPEMGTVPNVYYIDADHSDESDVRFAGQYIAVTTHRKELARR